MWWQHLYTLIRRKIITLKWVQAGRAGPSPSKQPRLAYSPRPFISKFPNQTTCGNSVFVWRALSLSESLSPAHCISKSLACSAPALAPAHALACAQIGEIDQWHWFDLTPPLSHRVWSALGLSLRFWYACPPIELIDLFGIYMLRIFLSFEILFRKKKKGNFRLDLGFRSKP